LIHSQFCSRIDESFLARWECRSYSSDEYEEMQRTLFEHLCPLLIIKMLPMKTFDNLNSSVMYGHLSQNKTHGIYSCLAYLPFDLPICLFYHHILLNHWFSFYFSFDVPLICLNMSPSGPRFDSHVVVRKRLDTQFDHWYWRTLLT
jgi:hypothetical protein